VSGQNWKTGKSYFGRHRDTYRHQGQPLAACVPRVPMITGTPVVDL